MLVSWKISRKVSSSSQLKNDLRKCRQHVESTLNLEILKHLDREDGFVQIRRPVQVLDVKLYPHEGRYCIDIMIEPLFGDQTVSWVRIERHRNVKGNTHWERSAVHQHRETCKSVVNSFNEKKSKCGPRPSAQGNLWQTLNQSQDLLWIQMSMFLFLIEMERHWSTTSIPREEDGEVRFDDLIEKSKELFGDTLQWTVDTWVNSLAQEGGRKQRFQYCLSPKHSINSCISVHSRTFRRKFRWSFIARQYTVTRWLRRVHLPHRERLRDAFHYSKWIDPGRTKQQEEQTAGVLHGCEPDWHSTWSKRSWIRSG